MGIAAGGPLRECQGLGPGNSGSGWIQLRRGRPRQRHPWQQLPSTQRETRLESNNGVKAEPHSQPLHFAL